MSKQYHCFSAVYSEENLDEKKKFFANRRPIHFIIVEFEMRM